MYIYYVCMCLKIIDILVSIETARCFCHGSFFFLVCFVLFCFCLFVVVVAISWAAPTAYGGSQARG